MTASTLADLAAADLDVLVVGGGIVGAGTALDAVTRGLRVGLVEAGDWGGGRSGRTSTVVHGGLVDLARIGVGGVAALRRERDLLLDRTAPHLVRRVPLLVPLHRGLPERIAVGAALSVYDAAAFSIRQPGVLPGHRQLTRRAVLRLAPSIAIADVTGAAQLHEAQVDDARLTLTVVRTAIAYGALARSRTPARRLIVDDDRVVGAEIEDAAGESVTVRARVVVLATGIDPSLLLTSDAGGPMAPSPVPETIHLVVPRARLRSSTGLVFRGEGSEVYVVPWGRHWIIGSTAAQREPEELLAELNRRLAQPIPVGAVESTFVSLAPAGADAEWRPPVEVPAPGLVLVRGGGLAGYRADAELATDQVTAQLGGLHPPATTTRLPLLGADGFTARWNQRHLLARRAGVHVLAMEHLLQRYGSGVDVLIQAVRERPELGRPLSCAGDYLAVEVWYALAYEDATRLEDVLVRRTRIAMETVDGGAEAAVEVVELMAAELGWDAEEAYRQISCYLHRDDR